MVATFDIGNSNVHIGLFRNGILVQKKIIPCDSKKMAGKLRAFFGKRGCDGIAIASVVPRITKKIVRSMHSFCSNRPVMITIGTKSPLTHTYQKPRTLGADRIALMTGAITRYRRNCIVVSFGTAITVDAVLKNGRHLGGLIIPGGEMCAGALVRNTALLGRVQLKHSVRLLGRSTEECIRSGIVNGTAYALQGIIQGIRSFTKRRFFCVATGGWTNALWERIPAINGYDENVCLFGIYTLYQANVHR